MEDEPMLEWKFITYSKDFEDYPGYQNQIQATMRSIKIIFLNYFVMDLKGYFLDGPMMQSVISASREKAAETASRAAENVSKTAEMESAENLTKNKLDITLHSPKIIIPQNATSKMYVSLDLGILTLVNHFPEQHEDEPATEKMKLEMKAINIGTSSTPLLQEFEISVDIDRLLMHHRSRAIMIVTSL